jgi:hypothetical protein
MKAITAIVIVASLNGPCVAGPRSSTNYAIITDAADAGGRRAASASYTNDGSVGLVAGISSVTSPAETAKHGYIAQLSEVTGLVVNAAAPSVNETATLQLAAWQLLDDATFLSVPAAFVAWSVVSGPITGIDASGLATAGPVYQNTPASVQGIFGGNTGSLNLTVLETIADNFGAYAGDGLGDDWQVEYFGQPPNPLAGPLIDADGDGQTNAFEFVAGLIPTDPNSIFRLRIEAVAGQPGQKHLIFSPRFADRTYVVTAKPSLLTGTFAPLGSFTFADDAEERTVTDLNASGTAKFYRIEITRP